MNSKNFNAAEKHFAKKQQQYENLIKVLTVKTKEQIDFITKLEKENQTLTTENQQLKEWIDRLLKYTELSKDDIKAACEKDKRFAELFGMFELISKHINY